MGVHGNELSGVVTKTIIFLLAGNGLNKIKASILNKKPLQSLLQEPIEQK